MVNVSYWGTGALKDFAFALLIGIIVGTYSSIYVAAPLAEWIDRRFFGATAAKKKELTRTRAAKRAGAVVWQPLRGSTGLRVAEGHVPPSPPATE